MPERDAQKTADEIAALGAWAAAAPHNWALVPFGAPEPFFATVLGHQAPPVVARLLLLRGWRTLHDYIVTRMDPNYGVVTSPIEFDHFELVALADGTAKLSAHRPGYVPLAPEPGEVALLGRLLYECYGLMMRFEEDGQLALRYADHKAMFARIESADGKWADGPLPLPPDPGPRIERVALPRDGLARAANLPFDGPLALETDLFMIPGYRTTEPKPRILYLFAAVDAATGARVVWERLSVSGRPDGLEELWEGLAGRLLTAILAAGRVPGAIHIRSPRVARFLRPLGLQLPFKLVTHAKLPALDAIVAQAVKEKTI